MMPLLRPSHPSLTSVRSFSTTPSCLAKSSMNRLAFEHINVPTYPYGHSQYYKQSNFGLYGTQKIRYGNMVSEKNEIKTRRYWRPNVHFKRLWSESLGTMVRIRITTRVLRTVDKVGGLDEYLLGEKAGRIKELGMGGWKLRWRIMQTDKVKERFRAQMKAMGLPEPEQVLVGSTGNLASMDEVQDEMRAIDEELGAGNVGVGEDLELPDQGEDVSIQEDQPRSKEKIEL